MLTYKGVAEDFAQDLTAVEKHLIFATQGQISGPNEVGAKVTTAAWKLKPSFYIVADQDRMIDPELEEKLGGAAARHDDPYFVRPRPHALSSRGGRQLHCYRRRRVNADCAPLISGARSATR